MALQKRQAKAEVHKTDNEAMGNTAQRTVQKNMEKRGKDTKGIQHMQALSDSRASTSKAAAERGT